MAIDRPRLLMVVDRNPQVQQLAVVLARPDDGWQTVEGTKVSKGSMGRLDRYLTRRGVFRLTDAVLGYRAEGTLNENGILGLGARGMRVWNFGWQVTMNRFLDRQGALDTEYERAAVTDVRLRALPLPGREPSLLAGNTLVVVESGETDATTATVANCTAGPLLIAVLPPALESQATMPSP